MFVWLLTWEWGQFVWDAWTLVVQVSPQWTTDDALCCWWLLMREKDAWWWFYLWYDDDVYACRCSCVVCSVADALRVCSLKQSHMYTVIPKNVAVYFRPTAHREGGGGLYPRFFLVGGRGLAKIWGQKEHTEQAWLRCQRAGGDGVISHCGLFSPEICF